MARPKTDNIEQLYTKVVRTRVTKANHERLEKLLTNSNCRSIGEVVRKILSREKILCFYKDVTLSVAMEELSRIRKELKAIGININQLTRGFNSSRNEAGQAFYTQKALERSKEIDGKIDRLMILITSLTKKWLQE
ncbi:plasmid mobilization relaxosome protein MobC [Pedobacter jejuensis]|uniref:Plasmid mobilization relaxosome protein MobC n=1 Tax=Pedobacter jejuensis TaxID=1268550 RepID=A0A3N0C1F8_9SPHI|nr:plasmid mobilization relaxosome protein MobC [Pedobacter jejuensis]RNL55562.1 plasmid mobilization relaxosome protein MobC [Pedobacter jejuensis]